MNDNTQFTALAEYYDRLNSADYKGYADYIMRMIKEHGTPDFPLTLELGCGTGSLTFELDDRGLDMIGADISTEMLNVAMDRAYDMEKNILFLFQDMRSFELYGTVGTIVCALDGLNYLETEADVLKTMKLVQNYLEFGGIFIFDVNTPWKFRNIFAKRDFFTEDGEGEVYMGWRSEWLEDEAACNFLLTLFIKNEDGSYEKREEEQTEHMWTAEQIKRCIDESGLELVAVHKDLQGTPAEMVDGEEKWYFVCKKRGE